MMKNIFRITVFAFLTCAGLSGCNDFFETIPGKQETLEDTFRNKQRTEQFLNYVYSFVLDDVTGERWFGPGSGQMDGTADRYGGMWGTASLEGNVSWDWHASNLWNLGQTTADNNYVGFWWKHFYKGIANASIFIANVDSNPELSPREKTLYKAEARALRASYYYHIFRQYGPFVIIGEEAMPLDAVVADLLRPRNTVDECVKYIADEFDMAAEGLDPVLSVTNQNTAARYGRWDQAQCKAYKAKLLLYAASPLFNGSPLMANVKNPDGTPLFPGTPDQTKWEKAKVAYEEFLTEFVPTYFDLHIVRTAGDKVDFYESYRQISSGYYEASKENISAKLVWHDEFNYCVTPYHSQNRGNGIDGGMSFGVTQEFVDMFFTNKGLPINEDPDYRDYGIGVIPDASHYGSADDYNDPVVPSRTYFRSNTTNTLKQWENREPRFYVCVTYNGSTWLNEATSQGKVTTTLYRSGNSGYNVAGHDSPYTGYGWRKTARAGTEQGRARHISCNMRLADVYLGYAETLNETDNIPEAMRYINMIRTRAGVPEYGTGTYTDVNGETKTRVAYPNDKDEVRKRIQRERLIELALEANRFFDVRRWMVADMEEGDGWIYPTYHNGGEGGAVHGLDYTSDTPAFFKKVELQTRVFGACQYFLPIPDDEVRRNPKMVQNHDWQAAVE
jgi:hypothetical protein